MAGGSLGRLLGLLHLLAYAWGALIVVGSVYLYGAVGARVPLMIAAAIIVAGPVEAVLVEWIQRSTRIPAERREAYAALVDHLTGLGFLAFLTLAIFFSLPGAAS